MTARSIGTPYELEAFIALLRKRALPITVEVTAGRRRSTEQNRLQRAIISEVSEQLGEPAEDVRAYIKLVVGVPILRAENELFAERYDAAVKGLPYETKLSLMREPLDLPVTRLMTVDQKTRFLEAAMQHYAAQGVRFDHLDRLAA